MVEIKTKHIEQRTDLRQYKYNSKARANESKTSSLDLPSAAETQPKVKELDRMHGLDTYDYGARQYDPLLCRWDRIDPLCEKYYSVSPYVYCMNNPVNAIDPDGRDIILVFHGNDGNAYKLHLSKDHHSYHHPKSQFVKDFFSAYNYNVRNGGGKYLKAAMNDSKNDYFVYDAEDNLTEKSDTEFYINNGKNISWESRKGLKIDEKDGGGYQSPATRLEHEFYHAYDYVKNGREKHEKKRKTKDDQYENQEEKEAVMAENITAIRNGENPRHSHGGETYDTISSTSTIEKR